MSEENSKSGFPQWMWDLMVWLTLAAVLSAAFIKLFQWAI